MNFTDQEQEHWDHVWGAQSEAQNCLTEAIAHASANTEIRRIGSGPYIIRTTCAVFCRATDAFAGTVTTEIRRFETAQEGNQWWADQGSEEPDEHEHRLFEGQFIDDARALAAQFTADNDEIPF